MRAYDPAAGETASALMPGLDVRPDPYEAAAGADVVALLTEWDEFRWLDFDRVRDADAPAGDRRRPQPARSGRDAPARVRRTAASGADRWRGSSITGGRGLRRLAPLRGVARARRRGRRGRQPLHGPARERRAPRRRARLRARRRRRLRRAPGRRARSTACCTSRARPARPSTSRMPLETLDVSSLGTRARARPRAARNDARFLLASTSEVYGDPARAPAGRDATTATSTRSGRGRCTTRRSGSPRRSR